MTFYTAGKIDKSALRNYQSRCTVFAAILNPQSCTSILRPLSLLENGRRVRD